LSRASGAAGDYLVPSDVEQQILEAARAESAIGRLAREVTSDGGSTPQVPVSTVHGTAAWVAENASVTGSDETFAQVALGAFKSTTKVIVSEELAKDARVPFDAYLASEVGQRIGTLEGAAFVTARAPANRRDWSRNVTAVTAATGSATAFKLADLVTIFKALPSQYRPRASWIINPDDFGSLASLVDTAGALVLPSLQGDPPSLFGRPVEVDANLAAPAANAKSLIFGDIATAYTIRRVAGVSVQRLEELHSDSGQLGYRARERVDGRVVLAEAARVLSHSAT